MWVMINPQRRHLKVRKSAESQRVLDALNSYVEDNTNEPMKWLVSFWQDQQNAFGYEELRQIVLDEINPQAIFDKWFQDYSNFITEKMTPLWRQGITAGAYSHPRIQALQAEGFSVATSSANVRNWLLNRTGELVTNCTNNQIESIRYIIAEARSKGLSSDETARYIRPTIGLTRQQAGANLKLYESTKEQLRANHPRMTDESIERKARNVAAKDAAKKQRTRAVTIARTENAYAYNYGNDEAIKQAEAAGLMPHMVPYWSTSHSGNVCPVCEDLEGMPIDEGTGEFSVTWHDRDYTCELPPMHPKCMCAIEYREESGESTTGQATESEPESVVNQTESEPDEMAALAENDWSETKPRKVTKEEKAALIEYAKQHGVNAKDFSKFDGDPELLRRHIDTVARLNAEFPTGKKVTITTRRLEDESFGQTENRTIVINSVALRDGDVTRRNIGSDGYFASQNPEDTAAHEFGHYYAKTLGINGIDIAKRGYYNVYNKEASDEEVDEYLFGNVSEYSVLHGHKEIIPELFAKHNSSPDSFTTACMAELKEVSRK